MPFYEASRFDVLFTQTASVTVGGTATETTLVGTGVGSATLPVNLLAVGRTIRVTARGYLSTKGAPVGNVTFRVRLGGIAGTAVLATAATALTASLSNVGLVIIGEITCRTAGGTGTVFSQGTRIVEDQVLADEMVAMVNTTTSTIDTTATQALVVSVEWATSDASNTCTISNLIIEALN